MNWRKTGDPPTRRVVVLGIFLEDYLNKRAVWRGPFRYRWTGKAFKGEDEPLIEPDMWCEIRFPDVPRRPR